MHKIDSRNLLTRPILVVVLPVGTEWKQEVHTAFERLLSYLPSRYELRILEPAVHEANVLDRTIQVAESKPDLLLIAALHGGSARVMVLASRKSGTPSCIWCHDERHSLASSALALEALRQLDHPSNLIHGPVKKAVEELDNCARAAAALTRLRDLRIGQIGSLHPNLVSCNPNPLDLHRRFGSWVVPIGLSEVQQRVKSVQPKLRDQLIRELRDRYTVSVSEESLKTATSVHLALTALAEELRIDVLALDCWGQLLPCHGVSPCLGFAFDDYRIACEGDLIEGLTGAVGEILSGKPGYVGDFYSLNETDGTAVSLHCGGYASLHAAGGKMEIAIQPPPGPISGSGIVISCHPCLPKGPAVISILHGEKIDQLHIRSAEIVETDFEEQMRVHVRVLGDIPSFRREIAGNHYMIFPGDSGAAWKQWADWSGVAVH